MTTSRGGVSMEFLPRESAVMWLSDVGLLGLRIRYWIIIIVVILIVLGLIYFVNNRNR